MKLRIILPLSLLLIVSVSAAGIQKMPSPDGTALSEAECRDLFLGWQSEERDEHSVTAVVCRDDVAALEALFGGEISADVYVLPTRGEAAAFCECHCGFVWLYPV